jgi:hypothetical protein
MRRRAHQILLATLLTLYGGVTTIGPALHDLLGSSHSLAKLSPDHGKAPAQSKGQGQTTHDCPICHFLAQGQLDADPHGDMLIDVVRIRPANQSPLFFPPAIDRPSSPRAPPLG